MRLIGFIIFCCVCKQIFAIGFGKKSYSCIEGTCQLNAHDVPGLAHGICLTTCGTGNIWPYPSGKVSISSDYSLINGGSAIKFLTTQENNLLTKFHENFRNSLEYIDKNKHTSNEQKFLIVAVSFEDDSVILPSVTNDESYELQVTTTINEVSVSIHGKTIFGVRHGLETLSQLITYDYFTGSLVIPNIIDISDMPKFPYRGIMVDVARNFISINKIKETIRAMGYNKMNVLHLHLSDTASFPLEIFSQPNMTIYGAYDADHYYSISDMKELVQFAHSYGVMILPEIDMPAHVSAGWQWGTDSGFGEFVLCADPDGTHSTQFLTDALEPPSGQLNIVNENVYPILRDVYQEVIELFQSDIFHLGGDEVIVGSDEAWASCYNSTALAQPILEYIDHLGLSRDERSTFFALWDNFTMRATGLVHDIYANPSDRTTSPTQSLQKLHIWGGAGADATGVTYNMMLQPTLTSVLPPSLFTVQVWDTTEDSIVKTLIGKGYDIILSNTDYVYLDCGNAGYNSAGGYWCQPYHEWYHIYDYIRDITEKWGLTEQELQSIQGSETLIWTEMVDDQNLSQKLWPRSAALAEALWSSNYTPETTLSGAPYTSSSAKNTKNKEVKEGRAERSWYEAAPRMLQWRQLLVTRGIAAEALQPRWCSQRDAYACYVDEGIPQ